MIGNVLFKTLKLLQKFQKNAFIGEAEEDFREAATSLVDNKDEEQELLRQAFALSEENEEENDEDELLRQAIAMSLEDGK